jgi:hypothetical protein
MTIENKAKELVEDAADALVNPTPLGTISGIKAGVKATKFIYDTIQTLRMVNLEFERTEVTLDCLTKQKFIKKIFKLKKVSIFQKNFELTLKLSVNQQFLTMTNEKIQIPFKTEHNGSEIKIHGKINPVYRTVEFLFVEQDGFDIKDYIDETIRVDSIPPDMKHIICSIFIEKKKGISDSDAKNILIKNYCANNRFTLAVFPLHVRMIPPSLILTSVNLDASGTKDDLFQQKANTDILVDEKMLSEMKFDPKIFYDKTKGRIVYDYTFVVHSFYLNEVKDPLVFKIKTYNLQPQFNLLAGCYKLRDGDKRLTKGFNRSIEAMKHNKRYK